VVASNPGFSSSTIEGPPSGCGLCRITAGGVRDRITIRLIRQLRAKQRIIDCERNPEMPDLLLSPKHPWHPVRLHTSTQILTQDCTGREVLFSFAHLSRNVSNILDYVTPKRSLMKSAGSLATEAIGMRLLWR
jgi:hypothetical protein